MSQLDLFGNPVELAPKPDPTPEPLTSPFDVIRQLRPDGREFWTARDMQPYLGYTEWRNFVEAIDRAKSSCSNNNRNPADHFVEANKMIVLGKGGQRTVPDYHLSRYACYLVAQNGSPSKPEIAAAQHYFAEQTRRAELAGLGPTPRARRYKAIGRPPEWIAEREQGISERRTFTDVLQGHGVAEGVEFAQVTDAMYMGLFRRSAKGMKLTKNLPTKASLRDNMTAGELSAVRLSEYTAGDKIEHDNLQGVRPCAAVSRFAGERIMEAIVDIKNVTVPG